MITAAELQHQLHMIEAFKGIEVREISPLAPWKGVLTGSVYLHGQPYFFESDLDLNEFNTQQDIHRLVTVLFATFEKAEKGVVDN